MSSPWSKALDFAYTHIFVKDSGIVEGALLQANVESSIDILSASLKIKW